MTEHENKPHNERLFGVWELVGIGIAAGYAYLDGGRTGLLVVLIGAPLLLLVVHLEKRWRKTRQDERDLFSR